MAEVLNNFYKELDEVSKELDTRIFVESNLEGYSSFYKKNSTSNVWWIDKIGSVGQYLFSFDRKKIYNIFLDYPNNLTDEEKEIFDKEEQYWKDFFKE